MRNVEYAAVAVGELCSRSRPALTVLLPRSEATIPVIIVAVLGRPQIGGAWQAENRLSNWVGIEESSSFSF
jgi:hypothetical protein